MRFAEQTKIAKRNRTDIMNKRYKAEVIILFSDSIILLKEMLRTLYKYLLANNFYPLKIQIYITRRNALFSNFTIIHQTITLITIFAFYSI